MALHTQQSLSGFIASEPQQTITENGDVRLYVRIGQPHFRRNEDGKFTELEPSFHDMVVYRVTAERALSRLAKGDNFVAEGFTRIFSMERDGRTTEAEEFVAKKLGHDLARTNYEVDRGRRVSRPQQDAAAHSATASKLAVASTNSALEL